MRHNNKLVIRLAANDLKQALIDYLLKQDYEQVAEHLRVNKWTLDYLYRGKEWSLEIDGIFDERLKE